MNSIPSRPALPDFKSQAARPVPEPAAGPGPGPGPVRMSTDAAPASVAAALAATRQTPAGSGPAPQALADRAAKAVAPCAPSAAPPALEDETTAARHGEIVSLHHRGRLLVERAAFADMDGEGSSASGAADRTIARAPALSRVGQVYPGMLVVSRTQQLQGVFTTGLATCVGIVLRDPRGNFLALAHHSDPDGIEDTVRDMTADFVALTGVRSPQVAVCFGTSGYRQDMETCAYLDPEGFVDEHSHLFGKDGKAAKQALKSLDRETMVACVVKATLDAHVKSIKTQAARLGVLAVELPYTSVFATFNGRVYDFRQLDSDPALLRVRAQPSRTTTGAEHAVGHLPRRPSAIEAVDAAPPGGRPSAGPDAPGDGEGAAIPDKDA